jgi:ankyrin repeat protein
MFYAVQENRTEIVCLLIKHKSNVNAQNTIGMTPLHEAARLGRTEIIYQLLKAGSDPQKKDAMGRTPAEHTRDEEVQKLLLKKKES